MRALSIIVASSILFAALPLAAQERRVVLYRQADGSMGRHPYAVARGRAGVGLVPRVGNLDCSPGTGANACLTFRCFDCFDDIPDLGEIMDGPRGVRLRRGNPIDFLNGPGWSATELPWRTRR